MNKADFYVAKVKHLQPAPTVVTKLLRTFSDPDHDLDQVVQLIRVEPTLTAEVLKRSNSVAFAGSEPATDIFTAISRIGMYEAYTAVATLTGSRAMAIGDAAGGIQPGELWRHSIITAVAAGNLASRVDELEASAFTAGLLHDLGKLIFSKVETARYAPLIHACGTSGTALVAAEQSNFEVNHARVGGCLLAHWGVPTNVVAAVMSHHQSPATALRCERLAAIVQVANVAARALESSGLPAEFTPHAQESFRILSFTPEELPELIEQTQVGLERVEDMLAIAG